MLFLERGLSKGVFEKTLFIFIKCRNLIAIKFFSFSLNYDESKKERIENNAKMDIFKKEKYNDAIRGFDSLVLY